MGLGASDMFSGKRAKPKQEFLDEFETAFLGVREHAPQIEMLFERRRKDIVFKVPRLDDSGFEIGAAVEEYGIYPSAGPWHGAPWEPSRNEWTPSEVCSTFFGFVRDLLSPSMRLRCTYRRNKLKTVELEQHIENKGWELYERRRFFVLPFGSHRETCLSNDRLPTRQFSEAFEFLPW